MNPNAAKSLVMMALLVTNAAAHASNTLNCSAPPYYLRVAESNEFGATDFSFMKETEILAEGSVGKWKHFRLEWPNGVSSKGNSLRFEGRFGEALAVSGTVRGEKGFLWVNGEKYSFQCDWEK